ncbi:unnamed protein product [Dovyalis caffra]|uniref:Uncharacterized protein n=1 Tax=Dovyalis caffra TaxID=77055 RepID=A0AAV1SIG4_9ROSI|nr:unnamed protein product [Dovyalis caffra]
MAPPEQRKHASTMANQSNNWCPCGILCLIVLNNLRAVYCGDGSEKILKIVLGFNPLTMVGHAIGCRWRNQDRQVILVEISCTIERLSHTIDAVQQKELVGARIEILEGDCDPLDIPEGGRKDETHSMMLEP